MVVLKVTLLLYRGVTGVIAWMPGSVHLSHTWGYCPTAVMSPNERPLSSGHPRWVRTRRRHRLRERSPSDWCCDVTPSLWRTRTRSARPAQEWGKGRSLNFALTLEPLTVRCCVSHTRACLGAAHYYSVAPDSVCVIPHRQCPRDHVTLLRRPPTGLEGGS